MQAKTVGAKPVILFVCNEVNYNLFNRKSAIDSILCSILEELTPEYEIYVNGVSFESEGKSKPQYVSGTHKGLKSALKQLVPTSIKQRVKLRKLLRNSELLKSQILKTAIQPDVIMELYKLGSNLGRDLSEKFGCKYFMYYDSPVCEQYEDVHGRKLAFKSEFVQRENSSIARADSIITYSDALGNYLKDRGFKGESYYFPTLDYTRLDDVPSTRHEGTIIGFIGSFMHWHRVDLLVEAFDCLISEGLEDIKLLLIGDGACFEDVNKQVRALPSKEFIKMTGFVDGLELTHRKSQIDIGVMPGSNWYGMPTKVFEYGVCGIPSIAPDTPTIKYLFKSDELMFTEQNNLDSLKSALRKLIVDKQTRYALGQSVKNRINTSYNKEEAISLYRKLLSSLLKNRF